MAQRPEFRVFVEDKDGNFNYKEEAFALWRGVTKDGDKTYWYGKAKDGRRIQMWPATKQESQKEEPW